MKHVLLRGEVIWAALQQETTSEFDLLWEILQSPDVQGYISHEDLMTLYGRIAAEQEMTLAVTLLCQFRRILEVYWANPEYPLDVAIADEPEPWLQPTPVNDIEIDVPILSVGGFLERYALEQLYDADLEPFQPGGWYRKWRASGLDPLLMIPIALTLTLHTIPALQEFLADLLNVSSARSPSIDSWLTAPTDSLAIAPSALDPYPMEGSDPTSGAPEPQFRADQASPLPFGETLNPLEATLLPQGSVLHSAAEESSPSPARAIASTLPIQRLPVPTPAPSPPASPPIGLMRRSPLSLPHHRPHPSEFIAQRPLTQREANSPDPPVAVAESTETSGSPTIGVASAEGDPPFQGRDANVIPLGPLPLIHPDPGVSSLDATVDGETGADNGMVVGSGDDSDEGAAVEDSLLQQIHCPGLLFMADPDELLNPSPPDPAPTRLEGRDAMPGVVGSMILDDVLESGLWTITHLLEGIIQLQQVASPPSDAPLPSGIMVRQDDPVTMTSSSWCVWPPSAVPTGIAVSSPSHG